MTGGRGVCFSSISHSEILNFDPIQIPGSYPKNFE